MFHKNIPNNNEDIIRFRLKILRAQKGEKYDFILLSSNRYCCYNHGLRNLLWKNTSRRNKINLRKWNCFFGQNRRWNRRTICKIKTTGLYKTGWKKHFCR